jgi:membrane protease YdiL (CAAX protease family)
MKRAQTALVFHALALTGLLVFVVPVLSGALGGPEGFLAALTLYWLGFCLPVIAFHVRHRRGPRLFSETLAWRDWWLPGLLLLQVGLVGLVVIVPNTSLLTSQAAMLAAIVALIDAPLGEIAWRGSFLTRFADRPRLGFWLSWLLFTAWHIPLALNQGLLPDGGWMVLVGGAAALGLLWTWIVWRTGSVFWVSIAHVLTNIMIFWVLLDRNGFA